MRPGGERNIVVPSAMAYGNATTVIGVPPDSTLVFDFLSRHIHCNSPLHRFRLRLKR